METRGAEKKAYRATTIKRLATENRRVGGCSGGDRTPLNAGRENPSPGPRSPVSRRRLTREIVEPSWWSRVARPTASLTYDLRIFSDTNRKTSESSYHNNLQL